MQQTKKKGKLKLLIIPCIIILAAVVAVAVFMLQTGDISAQQAQNIALAHVGGGSANWPERDFEDFQRVWSVEVFHNNLVYEVFVHRFTGEIVRVEIDR